MTATADAPTRTPDAEIDHKKVIEANWDSDDPSRESWRIVTQDARGNDVVHHEGTDLDLALRLGYHREAQRLHDEAAKNASDAAPQRAADEADRADFEAWRRERDRVAASQVPQSSPETARPSDDEIAAYLAAHSDNGGGQQ